MELCSDGHGEVAYVSSGWDTCPACAYAEEINTDMLEQVDELRHEIDQLQAELDEKE